MQLITKEKYLAVTNLPQGIFPNYSNEASNIFEDLIKKTVKVVNHSFAFNSNFRQYAAKSRTVFLRFGKEGCRVGFPLDIEIPDIAKTKEYKEQKNTCRQNSQSVCLYEEHLNDLDFLMGETIYIFGASLNDIT